MPIYVNNMWLNTEFSRERSLCHSSRRAFTTLFKYSTLKEKIVIFYWILYGCDHLCIRAPLFALYRRYIRLISHFQLIVSSCQSVNSRCHSVVIMYTCIKCQESKNLEQIIHFFTTVKSLINSATWQKGWMRKYTVRVVLPTLVYGRRASMGSAEGRGVAVVCAMFYVYTQFRILLFVDDAYITVRCMGGNERLYFMEWIESENEKGVYYN